MKVLVFLCLLALASGLEYGAPVVPASTGAPTYQAGVLHANPKAGDAAHGITVLTPNGAGDTKACACLGQPACPCNAAPSTCCHSADTCHPSVPKCSVVKATEVPKGSLSTPIPECCHAADVCHPSVPKCAASTLPAVPAVAPVASSGSISSDAAIPNIKWGQLPPNMQPVKVVGANKEKDECGCLHLPSCECRAPFTTPEFKTTPCTCHAEPECPCAAAQPAQGSDASCCPVGADCHPAVPKCGVEASAPACGCLHLDTCPCRTVEPEYKEKCGCEHLEECPCRQQAVVEPEIKETKLESNCCQSHETCEESKPKCPVTEEAPKCSCRNPNLVEAEAVDHLPCPCETAQKVEAEEVKPKCCSEEPCHAAVPKCMEASSLANGKNVAVVHGTVVHTA